MFPRSIRIFAVLAGIGLFVPSSKGVHAERLRAGVMFAPSGRGFLSIDGPALATGATLTVVGADEPQVMQRIVVLRRLPESDPMFSRLAPGSRYEVALAAGSQRLPYLAVAFSGSPEFERAGLLIALRLAGMSKAVYVRSCTSSEGIHLTLWEGEALRGRRLWHAYQYLGYDVAPSCKPRDYQ